MKEKIFKCKGISYYIKGCTTKEEASEVAIKNHWGVLPDDLMEVEEIDDSNAKVINK